MSKAYYEIGQKPEGQNVLRNDFLSSDQCNIPIPRSKGFKNLSPCVMRH